MSQETAVAYDDASDDQFRTLRFEINETTIGAAKKAFDAIVEQIRSRLGGAVVCVANEGVLNAVRKKAERELH